MYFAAGRAARAAQISAGRAIRRMCHTQNRSDVRRAIGVLTGNLPVKWLFISDCVCGAWVCSRKIGPVCPSYYNRVSPLLSGRILCEWLRTLSYSSRVPLHTAAASTTAFWLQSTYNWYTIVMLSFITVDRATNILVCGGSVKMPRRMPR